MELPDKTVRALTWLASIFMKMLSNFRLLVFNLVLIIQSCLLTGCYDPCENEILQAAISPDGKLKATAFIRGCGATTSSSVQVYLGAVDESPEDIGNVYRGTGTDSIALRWDDKKLIIQTNASTHLHTSNYLGIQVTLESDTSRR